MRNDARPGVNRLQQETILNNRAAARAPHCPECGKEARTDRLVAFPACVGYRCRPCGWEGAPLRTLNEQGQMVSADAQGRPVGEPLQIGVAA